ncbi:MAG: DUF350 domain-containing protein, partial [Caulobacteraceae bacterium]|nr:DUF350 domain-containing protein [Caulobacteraceae bacterium]
MSPEIQAFATGFPTSLAHAGVSALLLLIGAAVYGLLSPFKEVARVREGEAASALVFGGVVISLAIPLALSLNASTSLLELGIWGAATVVVQLLAFRLIDFLLRGLPQRVAEGEVAAAVVL